MISRDTANGSVPPSKKKNKGSDRMKSTITEDLTGDKLNRLIESLDEMFADLYENENEN
jgi:hypothetical protein